MTEVIYDTWLPYTEYEKHECDIKLKDGTILRHAWPNAGKFNGICDKQFEVHESEVAEIMYPSIHKKGCDFRCNGTDLVVVGLGESGRTVARAAAKGLNVSVVNGPYQKAVSDIINPYEGLPEVYVSRPAPKKHKRCSYRPETAEKDGVTYTKWVCACGKELK